ncbi:MAG TPA: hypothetical protein VIJ87_00465 [Pyrinomonadaceae bacterium]|jgi:hypothetical protein
MRLLWASKVPLCENVLLHFATVYYRGNRATGAKIFRKGIETGEGELAIEVMRLVWTRSP